MLNSEHINGTSFHSFIRAHQVIFILRQEAKANGYDTTGLRVVDKRDIISKHLGHADALICWPSGPIDWTSDLNILNTPLVYCTVEHNIISFYDS